MADPEALTRLRSLVYRDDGAGLVAVLGQEPWPADSLQLTGDGLVRAVSDGVDEAPQLARACADALEARNWDGDHELAQAPAAALGDGPTAEGRGEHRPRRVFRRRPLPGPARRGRVPALLRQAVRQGGEDQGRQGNRPFGLARLQGHQHQPGDADALRAVHRPLGAAGPVAVLEPPRPRGGGVIRRLGREGVGVPGRDLEERARTDSTESAPRTSMFSASHVVKWADSEDHTLRGSLTRSRCPRFLLSSSTMGSSATLLSVRRAVTSAVRLRRGRTGRRGGPPRGCATAWRAWRSRSHT